MLATCSTQVQCRQSSAHSEGNGKSLLTKCSLPGGKKVNLCMSDHEQHIVKFCYLFRILLDCGEDTVCVFMYVCVCVYDSEVVLVKLQT